MSSVVLVVEDDHVVRENYIRDLGEYIGADLVLGAKTVMDGVNLATQSNAAAIVVDLHLPPSEGSVALDQQRYSPNGYALARMLREARPTVPVFGLTSQLETVKPDCKAWFKKNGDPSGFIGVYDKKSQWVLLRHHLLTVLGQRPKVHVFIIHGHDHETRDELGAYAKSLGWSVEVLAEKPSQGRTWIERFESEAELASLAWVLFTADEWGCPMRAGSRPEPRARPNVLLECGYVIGAFGRQSHRVLLLQRGDVEFPSDMRDVARINLRKPVKEHEADFCRELAVWLLPRPAPVT